MKSTELDVTKNNFREVFVSNADGTGVVRMASGRKVYAYGKDKIDRNDDGYEDHCRFVKSHGFGPFTVGWTTSDYKGRACLVLLIQRNGRTLEKKVRATFFYSKT